MRLRVAAEEKRRKGEKGKRGGWVENPKSEIRNPKFLIPNSEFSLLLSSPRETPEVEELMAVRQRIIIAIGVGLVGALMACSDGPSTTGVSGTGEPVLPTEAAGWHAVDDGQTYDTESIYSYIDGHAEVYMAYGMVRCLSQRYSGPEGEPDILLDLFEQASPADAFGVFTHDRDGEEVEIGQGGLFRHGWLSFWKGRWFGSVYAEGDSEPSAEAVLALGRAAADSIDEIGEVPALVSVLPADGLDQRSVRFLHTQEILNGVVYLGYENVFRFGPEIDAVVGRYQRPEGTAWLLLVDYPDEATAALAEGGAGEAGVSVRRRGARLAAVLAPEPQAAANGLLADAMGGE
jgi:hypothetical protein